MIWVSTMILPHPSLWLPIKAPSPPSSSPLLSPFSPATLLPTSPLFQPGASASFCAIGYSVCDWDGGWLLKISQLHTSPETNLLHLNNTHFLAPKWCAYLSLNPQQVVRVSLSPLLLLGSLPSVLKAAPTFDWKEVNPMRFGQKQYHISHCKSHLLTKTLISLKIDDKYPGNGLEYCE